MSFADTVLEHSHSISVVEPTSSLGTFTAFVFDPANGDGNGNVLWQYYVNDAAIEYLGAGESITETFVMVLVDDQGSKVSKEVTVTVTGKNDAPEIVVSSPGAVISELADGDAGEGAADHTAEGTVGFSDLDLSDDHTVSVAAPSGHRGVLTATLAQDTTGGNSGTVDWNYVVSDGALEDLAEGETLVESFVISIDDGHGGVTTTIVNITLTGTNDAPVIDGAVAVLGDEDQASVVVDLLSNATDVDGDALNIENVGVTVNDGRVLDCSIDQQTGALVLDPSQFNDLAVGESVTINIDYAVSDGMVSVGATAVVTIEGRNDAPAAVADIAIVTEDGPINQVTGNVLDNDTDVDGDTLQVVSVNGQAVLTGQQIIGTYGSLLLNSDGSYEYQLDNASSAVQSLAEGQVGVESFTYSISDGHDGVSQSTLDISVQGTNDAPVVGDVDFGSIDEDTSRIFTAQDLMTNSSDIDADLLNITSVSVDPQFGVITNNGDGSWTFVPAANFHGDNVEISFVVSDGEHEDSGIATIDILSVNDAPIAENDSFVVEVDGTEVFNLLSNDSDIDGDPLTVTSSSYVTVQGVVVAVNSDGSFSYTASEGFSGTDSFTYEISDGLTPIEFATRSKQDHNQNRANL